MTVCASGNGRGSARAATSAVTATATAAIHPAMAEHGEFPPALRVVHNGSTIDLAAAERAAADFLHALGMDTTAESLRDTPRRMASAYAELLCPSPFNLTTFPNDEGYDELVLARAIPVHSVCELTCCRSWAWHMSATCLASGYSASPSSRGWLATSPAARRCRSGSPSR